MPDEKLQPEATDKALGTDLILAERHRQYWGEGWDDEHDDGHVNEELACAAACYAMPPVLRQMPSIIRFWEVWPWHTTWWKGDIDPALSEIDKLKARKRQLVKAGALCAAEIDRIDRLIDKTNVASA